jgi:hypothetical protein
MGSGLVFCLPQKSHTNKVNFMARMKSTKISPILRMRFCHAPLPIYKKSGGSPQSNALVYIAFV